MRHFRVIVQSQEDYYNEQYHKLRFIWWIISSILFTSLFYILTREVSVLWWVFLGFIFLFMYADLTRNQKMKANAHAFLGLLYFVWGILFFIFTIIFLREIDERIFGLGLTLVFLIVGGIKWVVSGGDKAKVESARGTIIAAIIGLIIVFLSFFIIQILFNLFGIGSIQELETPTILGP